MLSKVEGDYIKIINNSKKEITSFKEMAKKLDVSVATVNATVKRLEKKELLNYYQYKGVALTETGKIEAEILTSAHRLWEYFLVNKLGMNIDCVHDEAELLEHVTSIEMLKSLYIYLNCPKICPHGGQIKVNVSDIKKQVPLTNLKIKDNGYLIINEELKILIKQLKLINTPINFIVDNILQDGSYIIIDQSNQVILIPSYIVKTIRVIGEGR